MFVPNEFGKKNISITFRCIRYIKNPFLISKNSHIATIQVLVIYIIATYLYQLLNGQYKTGDTI